MDKIEEARKFLMEFAENLKKDLRAGRIEITVSSSEYNTACQVEVRFVSSREVYREKGGSCQK